MFRNRFILEMRRNLTYILTWKQETRATEEERKMKKLVSSIVQCLKLCCFFLKRLL